MDITDKAIAIYIQLLGSTLTAPAPYVGYKVSTVREDA
jgi:hypothetical protein